MKPLSLLRITIVIACLCAITAVKAQVCTGSLGDPVVNVTFGSGNNPGAPLSNNITTYNYYSFDCPNDGSYTLVNSTNNCFGNSWQTLTEDHTPGDNNGYMMLVNASYDTGVFYIDTIKGLCANTTYEFAAWVINVQSLNGPCTPPILPNLVFNIESVTGDVLGTYSTGDIPSNASPTWKQYGLFFKTPLNTGAVVIRLTNKAPGGCGNDLALDDITFRACGPQLTVTGSNGSQSNYDFCTGTTADINLSATLGQGYFNPAFQWQQSIDSGQTWNDIAGATTLNYHIVQSNIGMYKYRLLVAEFGNINAISCRVVSAITTVTIHDYPNVLAINNGPGCEGTVINLSASGGVSYAWTGPNNFTSNNSNPGIIASSQTAGYYFVSVVDQYGCSNAASTEVKFIARPVGVISSDKNICQGDSALLTVSGGTSYEWSPAAGLSSTTASSVYSKPADPTTYQVVVFNQGTCTDTVSVTVNVFKIPTADAGNDKVILKGQSVLLNGTATGSDVAYQWTPAASLNNATILTPLASPPSDITYTLKVTSAQGCGEAIDQMKVKVYNDLYIPTAFSPNNDGLNDVWRIEALAVYPAAVIRIYSRYGNLVYENVGSANWDGTYKGSPLPSGAYTYVIDLKNTFPPVKGMVMIVR